MAVILAVNMLVIGIFGSYQTAQAAEIVAGYTALEIIEGILLSFGISVFTADMVTTLTEDPSTAQDEYWRETQAAAWAEYMEAVYEDERKKGGGGSGPTPTPGISGTDIPSFKEVIQNMKDTGKIVLGAAAGAGVWECMSKAVSSLWDKIMGQYNEQPYDEQYYDFDLTKIDNSYPLKIGTLYAYWKPGNYAKYVNFYAPADTKYIIYNTSVKNNQEYWHFYNTNDEELSVQQFVNTVYYKKDGSFRDQSFMGPVLTSGAYSMSLDKSNYSAFVINFNLPIYIGSKSDENLDRSLKKENIWVHPDLQDIYKNNGKLDYPQQAPQPLQIPSIAQLTDLANKLKTNPQQAPNSVQELIDLLKQNPQPQPTVAPNPNPDPNPNPNPEVSPKPDDTDTDVNPDDYKADLRLVFPFCIPFDLIHLIQAFEAEPEAPVFEFPLDLELENPWTGKKILDYHHTFKLDMSDYEPVIKIFRIFEIIFFIIGLLMITRQQMIKG